MKTSFVVIAGRHLPMNLLRNAGFSRQRATPDMQHFCRLKPAFRHNGGPRERCVRIVLVLGLMLAVLAPPRVRAAEAPSTDRPGGFKFDTTISREVLENYLSRSVSMEGVLHGRGADFKDSVRMVKEEGVKYVGRALCLWGAERNFLGNIEKARQLAPEMHAADPDMILEGCVFETVGPGVSQIAIPDWVLTAFGQPVTNRNFVFEDIIYPANQRRSMGGGGSQVPDVSRLETRMWFYYQACEYIDVGCEGIHFGQVEIMNRNDKANNSWAELIGMVRQYAAKHARRHMVLCNGHTPTGGLQHDGNPILDFNAFPLRIKENTNGVPLDGILQIGFSDGMYGKSKGGKTFSGWSCEHLPYLVEFDNFGQSRHPGQSGGPSEHLYIWGYDEISWFGHLDKDYRSKWLQYAWDWLAQNDPNAHLQMPASRTATTTEGRWYSANNKSDLVPNGRGDEAAIRAVWVADSAKLKK
jgi:hypothetical protein